MSRQHDLLRAYEASLTRPGHVRDPAQEKLVQELAELAIRLETAAKGRAGLLCRWFSPRGETAPLEGLYIWGGVGRGKTWLMDLFFDNLHVVRKRRIHFHRMMAWVHGRLGRLDGVRDPIASVADDVSQRTRVLCFDEFFVSDIGDAMILGRLLDALFERGITLVATSNVPPDELYRDGLQRARFLPAIELIERHTKVLHIDGGVDYRLRLLKQAGTYLDTSAADTEERLAALFGECGTSTLKTDDKLEINGRTITAKRSAKGVAWFDFDELCEGPRSQEDYIELARCYPTVLIDDVPVLGAQQEDAARRFVSLVDEFYDRRVKLIVAAEAPADELYEGKRLGFEFQRTSSRLIEMQSEEYLQQPHLP